jgi:hypothetical protein
MIRRSGYTREDLERILEARHDPAALRAENARLRARVVDLEALVRRQRAWVDHPDVPFIYGGATAELAAIDHELYRLGLGKADK